MLLSLETTTNPLAAFDKFHLGPITLRPVASRPKTPISKTKSVAPEVVDVLTVRQIQTTAASGFRLRRRFRLDGVPFEIGWTVRFVRHRPIALVDIRFRNVGDRELLLDQDYGDTHDGIQLLSSFGLDDPEEPYQYCVQRAGQNRIDTQPLWRTHPSSQWVAVSERQGGAVALLRSGETAPKMVVIDQETIDFMINEFRLAPGAMASYQVALALWRGTNPDADDCRQRAAGLRQWLTQSSSRARRSGRFR